MVESSGGDLRAPIFNGDNYEFWKIRMGTIFKLHGVRDLVEKGLEIPESKGKKVEDEGSSDSEKASLIDKLMKDAKGLHQDFEYTRMKDDETLYVYLTCLLELVNQMKGYGEDLPRECLVQKLLISLTKEFDPDIESIEVQEVIAALRGFAQCLDRHAESTTEKAFSSMSVNPRGTQSNSSFGNSKPKKNWKSKGKKWDPIP
ncbi:uncharacterized protein [Pyrus communis]|uniref:uncharacterized protein n=1 Tax=Pyrus communis TaxID=23211 RepID=UPI0035C23288